KPIFSYIDAKLKVCQMCERRQRLPQTFGRRRRYPSIDADSFKIGEVRCIAAKFRDLFVAAEPDFSHGIIRRNLQQTARERLQPECESLIDRPDRSRSRIVV